MTVFALIPVKNLGETKMRLSPVLGAEERRVFLLFMLMDVLEAVLSSSVDRTVLIGSDTAVRKMSLDYKVDFLSDTGDELNHVLEYATDWSIRKGAEAALILPADVPLVTSADIDRVVSLCSDNPSVAVSPSYGAGTNALMRNPPQVMPTYFGAGSYKKHVDEASKTGIPVKIYRSPTLFLDIDLPRDLRLLFKLGEGTGSHQFLKQKEIDKRLNKILL